MDGVPIGAAGHVPRRFAPRDLAARVHRQLIGYLGLLLPLMLYVVAGTRPVSPLPRWHLLSSVSAYYYTGAVGIFVGILFALALFLLAYRGYEGERADRVVGSIGGLAAIGVVMFPTAAPVGVPAIPWWQPVLRTVHYVSATTLFVAFILFALWLFRRTGGDPSQRTPGKRRRDLVFLVSGVVMILSVLWAGTTVFTHAPMFVPETLAIEAFAVSWLVKGGAHEPLKPLVPFLRDSLPGPPGEHPVRC
jgi:heme A synthase